MDKLQTSVVISTYNRPEGVKRLLHSLAVQTIPPVCVHVVDQSKAEKIREAVVEFRRETSGKNAPLEVHHHAVNFQGLTKSRNYGLDQVKTPVTTFIDDDVVVGATYIEKVLGFLEKNESALMIGGLPSLPGSDQAELPVSGGITLLYRRFFNMTRPGDSWRILPNYHGTYIVKTPALVNSDYISGSNFSVRTDVAKKVRFDEKLIWYSIGEDLDFPIRIREVRENSVFLDPDLPITHHESASGKVYSEFLLMVHSCHHYYLFRKHWDHTFNSVFQFARCRLGEMMMPCIQHRIFGVFPDLKLLWRSIRVEVKTLAHIGSVFKGSFPL